MKMRTMKILPVIGFLGLFSPALAMATCVADEPKYSWKHEQGKSLSLVTGDKTVWTFRFAADAGYPYIHPLCTVDGTVLTAMEPVDHLWHRGVWFAWKFLNGVNYYDWAQKKPPVGPPEGQTRRTGEETVQLQRASATVTMDLEYFTAGKTVLKEHRRLAANVPRFDGSYSIDWELTFTACDAAVACSGPYGTLGFRGGNSMREYRVLDSEGRGKPAKGYESGPAHWSDISGLFGPTPGVVAGVAIFDHPDNPGHPSPWTILAGQYGAVGPAFTRPQPYVVPAGKSFTLKYRVFMHSGWGDAARLHQEFDAYKSLKPLGIKPQ